MGDNMNSADLDRFQGLVNFDNLTLRVFRDRYTDKNGWGWHDDTLKDRETMEPVLIDGNPPWEWIVFLPDDIKYLLQALGEMSRQYNELFELCGRALAELEQQA